MLKPLIKDKEVLRIMAQESNMEKIKHRLTYRLHVMNHKGEKLGTISGDNGQKTPANQFEVYRKRVHKGQNMAFDWSNALKMLKMYGRYTSQKHKDGTVAKASLVITMKKG